MTTIIYIAAHSHSGSTLLDMLLSGHPRIVGLGEVRMLIEPEKRPKYLLQQPRPVCSCGATIDDCALWSPFIRHLTATGHRDDYAADYRKLIQLAKDMFGPGVILSDSSKYKEPLSRLASLVWEGRLPNVEVKVIHLIKDVRSHTASLKKRFRLKFFHEVFRRFGQWYAFNIGLEATIRALRLDYLRIGYEELCFQPASTLQRICAFMRIDYLDSMVDLRTSNGHVGLGNEMRSHPTKSKELSYDYHWFTDGQIHLAYALRRRIRRFNEMAVYGNHLQDNRNGPANGHVPSASLKLADRESTA